VRLIKSRKLRQCYKCHCDIWPSEFYYPQRREKAICLKCGVAIIRKRAEKGSFLIKLLNWLADHGVVNEKS